MSAGDGDRLQRFLFERFPVRGYLVHLDASWRALIEHHEYPEVVRDTLGHAVAATMLLAATLKFEGQLTLQMQGPGPMHLLVVQATHRMAVRGVARYRGVPTESRLEALTGGGQLAVTVESPDRAARYQGIVPLSGDRLAECFEDYFARSEQLPTRLWLAATRERAAGLLLQRLPTAAAAGSAEVEHAQADGDEDWNRVLHLAGTVTGAELAALPAAGLLRRLFHEEDVRLFEPGPVFFQCSCSRERVNGILRSLGEADVRDLLAERGSVEVRCEYCNRTWRYDAVDVAGLFAGAESVRAPRALQ
jgi:molecular chaperone Hsp33